MIQTLLAFIVFLVSIGFGFCVVRSIGMDARKPQVPVWFSLAAGAGVGVGINSLAYFLALNAHLNPDPLLILLLDGVASAVLILRNRSILHVERVPWRVNWTEAILLAVGLIASLWAINQFGSISTSRPDGGWDAWAIWNLHAKYLYSANPTWTILFKAPLGYSHNDYPLLTPGFIALGWSFIGGIRPVVPILTAFVFTFGTAAVLFAALWEETNAIGAALAATVLVLTPGFVSVGAGQYADVPLAYFILVSLAAYSLGVSRGQRGYFALSGIAAGLAGWTKNEGLGFAAIFLAVLAARQVILWKLKKPVLGAQLGWFLAGVLPLLFVIGGFKIFLSPPNDLMGNRHLADLIQKITDLSRYKTIFTLCGPAILQYYGIPIALVPLAGILFFGVVPPKKSLGVIIPVLFLVAVQYFVIYVITPNDLTWHIQSSFHRLLTHVFPSLLFVVFLLLNLRAVPETQ